MADERRFEGVTPEIWERVQEVGRSRHGTTFEDDDGTSGRAVTRTPVGEVVLCYTCDVEGAAITYRIERKPFLVSANQIWSGIAETITRCRRQA